MKLLGVLVCALVFNVTDGQYYYNDIIGNQQNNRQFVLTKNAGVRNVSVIYTNDNSLVDTIIQQQYSADYKESVTRFLGDTLQNSVITKVYENDKIQSSLEKNKSSETKTEYGYDEQERIKTIQSVSNDKSDSALNYSVTELHNWSYNNAGKPLQMLRIKNNTDTLTVNFMLDETGNVVEEHWLKKGTDIETYYYYYNKENRLTDIVRFNKKFKRLLPDFTFEYNARGFVTQMLQVPNSNNTNYLVWTYVYNSQNLKQEEVCTNKQKRPIGKMEYIYQ